MTAWLLALACVEAPAPHPAEAWAQALSDPAAADCTALGPECEALRARALASSDEHAAVASCEAIEPGLWKDECFFGLADELDATGEKARALCATAGRFSHQCLSHARSRETRAPGVLRRSSP